MVEQEKNYRVKYSKLERRFTQLEKAFEKSIQSGKEINEELRLEKLSNERSRDTVVELSRGIKTLQGAVRRASEYKTSAFELKDALMQAQIENESLINQVHTIHLLKEDSFKTTTDIRRDDTTNTTLNHDNHITMNVDLQRKIEDIKIELQKKNEVIQRSEELVELLTRKEEELIHTLQVKEAMLNDQISSILGLKDRLALAESEMLNAENVILGLEEQLEDSKQEVSNLERINGSQALAEENMRSILRDYHLAVRSQLEKDEEDEETDDDM